MLLRPGYIKNKMANNEQVKIEEENLNLGEARGLLNPEIIVSSVMVGQPITQSITGAIP